MVLDGPCLEICFFDIQGRARTVKEQIRLSPDPTGTLPAVPGPYRDPPCSDHLPGFSRINTADLNVTETSQK
ncbi:hypothetical protein DPMN_036539 [Dreissena polymorpha]|uniref:Uncharacterized protein n=1 Tax=Dreissena polymorpha TaxID=45954 RepID=A0A9D4M9B4_DREPO|nr:hypothetical protein DPMN_036539 [Dreissena polymorpha]